MKNNSTGTLYIVATPIGNLEDMTLRAIRILKEVSVIASEDTRVTRNLLKHYEISTKLISYHSHASASEHERIIKILESGSDVALVSDAGTPAISDPGVLLVAEVYKRFGNDARVVPIPGASAVISALSASGLPASEFHFYGFLPHKKGRETIFKQIAETETTVAFYESTHRIEKALESLAKYLPENREVVIGRELTKHFEEFIRGTPAEVIATFKEHTDHARGEFVVMVGSSVSLSRKK